VNAPITKLFGLVIVLFAILVFATSWWTEFGAQRLRDNPLNRRQLLEDAKVKRGRILADDGTVLARSVKAQGDTYRRIYPNDIFSHEVGYSFTNLGRAGLESSRNQPLTGQGGEVQTLIDQLSGRKKTGNDVVTNLDPAAQKVALDQLAGRKGSVVALEPQTGKVRVMASVPGFDQNAVPDRFRQLNRDSDAPLLNRSTQAGYPPGSTFKVVTATAALDSGKFNPDTTLNGDSGQKISGVPLANDGGEDFGPINMTDALTHSVNTYWAQIGEKLGKSTMAKYMLRYGFYRKPPLDYPNEQKRASGEYSKHGRLLSPTSGQIDVGRMAIGQDKLAVTPLQMASVAATIGNGGVRVKPRLTSKIVDPDGRTSERINPQDVTRVMSESTAKTLAGMMSKVVQEGTGTAAALEGIDVAGKTGTAEIDVQNNITQPWFIAFAPVNNPRIAIAATVERSDGGFGGTVAAPIAKAVMEQLLRGGSQQ
jgi:peptidoglycan glycosyltransferase